MQRVQGLDHAHVALSIDEAAVCLCSRFLWVDALCIDQSSIQERAQQVQLMKQIFAEARSVVIDLGEVEECDDALLKCFSELDGISPDDWTAATAKFNYPFVLTPDASGIMNTGGVLPWIRSNTAAARSFIWRVISGSPSPRWEQLAMEPRVWTGLKRFLERPWFGRLWVIQEFALARRVNVLIGASTKGEEFLTHTLSRMQTHLYYSLHSILNEHLFGEVPKEDVMSHTSRRHSNMLRMLLTIR